MRRREFILTLGGIAIGLPVPPFLARAQQATRVTIGVLNFENPEPFRTMLGDGRGDLGYVEGRNLNLEARSAEGNRDRLPGFAAERFGLNITLPVASPTPAVV